jgi:hypothetical protein
VFGRLENTIGIPLLLSDLGALYERTGRRDEATAYRERAREILARLDLTGILDLAAGGRRAPGPQLGTTLGTTLA